MSNEQPKMPSSEEMKTAMEHNTFNGEKIPKLEEGAIIKKVEKDNKVYEKTNNGWYIIRWPNGTYIELANATTSEPTEREGVRYDEETGRNITGHILHHFFPETEDDVVYYNQNQLAEMITEARKVLNKK